MNARTLYCGRFSKFVCLMLAVITATGPSAATLAQQPAGGDSAQHSMKSRSEPGQIESPPVENRRSDTTLIAAPNAGKIDLTYVTSQAVAVAALRPQQLLRAPAAQMLPVEVASAAGLKELGADPVDVTEIVAFFEPPQYGVIVKFSKPFLLEQLAAKVRAHTQPANLNDIAYLQSGAMMLPSFYMPDNTTLLAMPDTMLRRVVELQGKPQSSPLINRVREVAGGHDLYAAVDVATIRPLINPLIGMAVTKQGDAFPTDLRPFIDAPNLISAAELTFNISSPGPISLIVHGNDDSSAMQVESMIGDAMRLRQARMMAEGAKLAESDDPVERAYGHYMQRMSTSVADQFHLQRNGESLILFQTTGHGDSAQSQLVLVAVIGVLVALLLPAVQAAREAARRNQSMSQMKQMILSMHEYADVKKSFPAHAICDAEGKPLLSWRVQVLPYLEQQALYNQFHLDEPWDSPNNKPLIARMPDVFKNPNLELGEGKTNYLGVVGKECIFDGSNKGMKFQQITDGTSKTVMLVEANADRAVEWTKPDDFPYDAKNPAAGLGSAHPGGWLAAFADGHISFVDSAVDPQIVKALFTCSGHEAVQLP
jgi:type II secretory pathway pseudopilin PulG